MPQTGPSRWRHPGDLAPSPSLFPISGFDSASRLIHRSTRSTLPLRRSRSARARGSHPRRRCAVLHCPGLSLTRRYSLCRLEEPILWDARDLVRHHRSLRASSSPPDLEMYRWFDITTSSASNLPRAIIAKAIPDVTIEKVKAIPPAGLQRLYEITLGDSRTMLLAMSPPEMLRLLRSEQSVTRSEGVLAHWLADAVLSRQRSDLGRTQALSPVADKEPADARGSTEEGNEQQLQLPLLLQPSAVGGAHPVTDEQGVAPGDAPLLDLLPSLVAQSAAPDAGTPYEPPFALFNLPQGVPLISLDQPLTQRQQDIIDYQVGRLARRLSQLTPESGRFGPVLSVLSPAARPPMFGGFGMTSGPAAAGSWSLAFHTLLEAVLRDAEDMAVVLPYANIRRHFRRLQPVLDEVASPHLVIVNIASRTNLLVTSVDQEDTAPTPRLTMSEERGTVAGKGAGAESRPGIKEEELTSETRDVTDTVSTKTVIEAKPEDGVKQERLMSLTGLRDWSSAVFGDPLFARVFTQEEPNPHFLRGFSGPPNTAATPDDGEHTTIRLLLYQCYHDIVDIVTSFYRPNRDSRAKDLAARKRLTVVLTKLEKAELPSSMRRHRRLSGDISPAKRAKIGGDEDADSVSGHADGSSEIPSRALLPRSYTNP